MPGRLLLSTPACHMQGCEPIQSLHPEPEFRPEAEPHPSLRPQEVIPKGFRGMNGQVTVDELRQLLQCKREASNNLNLYHRRNT